MTDYAIRDRELKIRGLCAGEGFWVLERMLHLEIVRIFVTKGSLQRIEQLLLKNNAEGFLEKIEVMDGESLSDTAGYRFHRGVYAVARRPELKPVNDVSGMPLLGCIDIRDPDNLGSLIRSAAAFGCGGIVVTDRSADPFSRKVIRTSMAHVLRLPLYRIGSCSELQLLKERGYSVTAAGLGPRFREIGVRERESRKRLILMGNEAEGLSSEWIEAADETCMIPMAEGVDSLNVSVAAGIVLWELLGKPG